MIKTATLQILKVIATVVITMSAVYVILRLVSGDPELARRGLVRATSVAKSDNGIGLLRDYPRWLKDALLFRFPPSYYSGVSPGVLIRLQIGRTALLAVSAFALSMVCAVGFSIAHTRWPGRITTALLSLGSRIVITIPEFWLAIMLLFFFAIRLPLFPLFGADSIAHYVLPLLALSISRGAVLFSILDAEMRRESNREYVLSAHLRSISRWHIAVRYQLRNAITVLIPIGVIQFGYLFGGAVIIEQVFGISGFGTLLLQALQRRDYPVAEACVYIVALVFAVLGVCADALRRRRSDRINGGIGDGTIE